MRLGMLLAVCVFAGGLLGWSLMGYSKGKSFQDLSNYQIAEQAFQFGWECRQAGHAFQQCHEHFHRNMRKYYAQ